jgi:restriction system protein
MSIPDYQAFMLPLLRRLGDGQEHFVGDLTEALANEFGLSEDDRKRSLPSGTDTYLRNRVGWARTYLKKAGLIAATRRGYAVLTERGREVLRAKPPEIDNRFLQQFPEFVAFKQHRRKLLASEQGDAETSDPAELRETPEETLAAAYGRIRDGLKSDVLEYVRAAKSAFFERLVVELLVAMGYGGSRADAGRAVGGSGDGGIDGIIKEDRLGLDTIYLQAKRWDGSVGRPEIQKFAGALQGQRARKGVFITTSQFTEEARSYVDRIDSKIVLIDGEQLATLTIDHNIGVSLVGQYEIKRVDGDYFLES